MGELLATGVGFFALLCGLLPLAIGRHRGLQARQLRTIVIAGLAFGWTGFGALLAWFKALTDDPHDGVITITITVTLR